MTSCGPGLNVSGSFVVAVGPDFDRAAFSSSILLFLLYLVFFFVSSLMVLVVPVAFVVL